MMSRTSPRNRHVTTPADAMNAHFSHRRASTSSTTAKETPGTSKTPCTSAGNSRPSSAPMVIALMDVFCTTAPDFVDRSDDLHDPADRLARVRRGQLIDVPHSVEEREDHRLRVHGRSDLLDDRRQCRRLHRDDDEVVRAVDRGDRVDAMLVFPLRIAEAQSLEPGAPPRGAPAPGRSRRVPPGGAWLRTPRRSLPHPRSGSSSSPLLRPTPSAIERPRG